MDSSPHGVRKESEASAEASSIRADEGAFRSPEDPNDCIFELLAEGGPGYYTAEMPEEFDLRKYSKPSRDQGSRGTCAAFTMVSIREIHSARSNDKKYPHGSNSSLSSPDLSPEFIYYHRDSKPLKGMNGRNAFQILQRIGTVPESEYPYSERDHNLHPDDKLYKLAAKYRLDNFAKIESCDGLKQALLEIGPCYLLLPLYANRPYFWRIDDTNQIQNQQTNQKPRNTIRVGGHAVAVVGYTKLGFILKNSWGSTWNEDGCIIFPYSDWGVQWECWVGIDGDNQLSRRMSPKNNPHNIKTITNKVETVNENVNETVNETDKISKKIRKFFCCL